MGFLDLFKATENKRLKHELELLKETLDPQQSEVFDVSHRIAKLKEDEEDLVSKSNKMRSEISKLDTKIHDKKKQLIVLDDEILMQDFGLYKPLYVFVSSDEYKSELQEVRNKQKEMIKNKTAVSFYDGWTVNGSKAEGKKMTNNNIKQILKTFNTECEVLIDKVKFNNFDSMVQRIKKSCDALNKMNESNKVSIEKRFVDLKIKELHLAYEYQVKKQEEKEEQKRIREELREEAKLQKELEEAKKNVAKDLKHFSNALESVKKQLESDNLTEEQRAALDEKRAELEGTIDGLNKNLADIDYRQNNQRAGYVYIISNIGAFGDNVFKIGMTRRLDPMERVDELGDASVPFNFDVHAMIFSEDAPTLENALHKAFEAKKLNMINARREFFNVTLEEIETVVKANYDKTVEFTKIAVAEQYRESLKLRKL